MFSALCDESHSISSDISVHCVENFIPYPRIDSALCQKFYSI